MEILLPYRKTFFVNKFILLEVSGLQGLKVEAEWVKERVGTEFD